MRRKMWATSVVGALSVGAASVVALPALAATATNSYDTMDTPPASAIVGVGSDTTQIVVHDLTVAYNNDAAHTTKWASWSAEGSPSSITLRSGGATITRPNGSGPGKASLYGAGNVPDVDFARSSSTLSADEISGDLSQAAFAVDGLAMAVSSTSSNAPATLTPAQIVSIYKGTVTNWSEVGGTSGTIKPLIPQSGSGTRKFFEAKLKEANGNQAVTLAGSVVSTQEHSDTDIKNDANAIAPFSTARAASLNTIALRPGTDWKRAVYNVVRNGDLNTKPLLNSLFGQSGFVCSAAGRTVIEAAGFKQLASAAQGGKCGVFTQNEVTNLKTAGDADKDTTTALTGSASNGGNVSLSATITGANTAGSVAFTDGGNNVGSANVASGKADLALSNVSVGDHTYKATFTPTDPNVSNGSESADLPLSVKKTGAVTLALSTTATQWGHSYTATVNATSDGNPATGTVDIKLGSTTLKTLTLSGGQAVGSLVALQSPGAKSFKAVYNGSADTFSATSTAQPLTIVRAVSRTGLGLPKKTVRARSRAQALIVVTLPNAAKGVYAPGKVQLKSGKTLLATGTLKKGQVIVTLPKLRPKKYSLIAIYSGSAGVKSSYSKASIVLTVVK